MSSRRSRTDPVEALSRILERGDQAERSLVVVNRTRPEAVMRLLQEAFGEQTVAVTETDIPDTDSDVVLLLDDTGVIATSTVAELMQCCLVVNGDLYRTGTTGIERNVAPPTITRLDDVVFDLKGYPASNKQKLLLIIISRFIERRALLADGGRFRSTFQKLSRLQHENGTRLVYERLRESDVDVHVYGVGDADVPEEPGFTTHTGTHRGYREAWSVIFVPEDSAAESVALIALETGRNEWRGMWTFDAELAGRAEEIIRTRF
jgi:hypothetical protein